MTLKDLCDRYRESSSSILSCCNYRGNYLISNKGNFHHENIDESDLRNLRPYLLCDILSMYEYLHDESEYPDWYKKYENVYCSMEDNDDYRASLECTNGDKEVAKRMYESAKEGAIEPFKKHGIFTKCFDYTY